ncbi:MAG: hypothetical protein K0V04_41005, partial [Deltaproteobacteria bacterium]|nr:hypothetical protein [Deltaproteobacteria bacterium]
GARLRALSQEATRARHGAAAGTQVDMVVHRRPRRDGQWEGLTDDYLRVSMSPGGEAWAGRRIEARLCAEGLVATPLDAAGG